MRDFERNDKSIRVERKSGKEEDLSADIMRISRLRIGTDGRGVCTLVLFYGCFLNCPYCINMRCKNLQTLREKFTPESLLEKVKIDHIYFRMTGGGITFGGGEPIVHSEFIHAFFQICDPMWKRRIETSLNCDWKHVERLISDIEDWYIDVKDMNPQIYQAYTGMNNERVIQNLWNLAGRVQKNKIHVRLPRIPNYNTEQNIKASKAILKQYIPEESIEVFDYIF